MKFIDWGLLAHIAQTQLGKPYQFGFKPDYVVGNNPSAFDCSAFVKWVYTQVGVDIPDGSEQQFEASVPVATMLQVGDVGFFRKPNEPTHHVGMILSEDLVIEARGYEPTLEAQGIKTNCVLTRPRANWEAFSEFVGWRRLSMVLP